MNKHVSIVTPGIRLAITFQSYSLYISLILPYLFKDWQLHVYRHTLKLSKLELWHPLRSSFSLIFYFSSFSLKQHILTDTIRNHSHNGLVTDIRRNCLFYPIKLICMVQHVETKLTFTVIIQLGDEGNQAGFTLQKLLKIWR